MSGPLTLSPDDRYFLALRMLHRVLHRAVVNGDLSYPEASCIEAEVFLDLVQYWVNDARRRVEEGS